MKWFCQKQRARATAKVSSETTSRVRSSSRCSTMERRSSWLTGRKRAIAYAPAWALAAGLAAAGRLPLALCLLVRRLRRCGRRGRGLLRRRSGLAACLRVSRGLQFLALLILAGDRVLELAHPLAQSPAQLRQTLG